MTPSDAGSPSFRGSSVGRECRPSSQHEAVVVELIAGLQAEDRLTEQQHSLVLEHLDDTPPGELFEILHRWTMEAHPDVVTRARQTDIIDQAVLVCVPERRLDPRTLGALDDDLADVMSDVGHVQGAR